MPSEEKVALVIGASRGIGYCTALALARAGANVAVASRSEDDLRSLAREIERLGRKSFAVKTDVTRKEDIENVVRKTVQRLGSIDIFVYASGVVFVETLAEGTDEIFDQTMAVNLKGPYRALREVLNGGGMLQRKNGRIILIGSDSGKIGAMGLGVYTATKHALLGLVRCLALEVGHLGITVNAVCPGFVWTKMAEDLIAPMGKVYGVTDPNALNEWVKGFDPLHRISQPEEIADMVQFLSMSPGGGAITGQGFNMATASAY
jgi:NAD(P)-dependent dehydrogenase (short-subunit alcohol dehydrogenase family)